MGTFIENKERAVRQQTIFDGVAEWHSKGILGQNMCIWNLQSETTHGKQTTERVKDAAPETRVFNIAPFLRTDRNGDCIEHTVTVEGMKMDIEEFIKLYNIKVITSSKQDLLKGDYWRSLAESYDICMFQSSGNDGKKRDFTAYPSMVVGACSLKGDMTAREGYSDYGEGLDFLDFVGGYSGTSFSAPYLAGKCALIRQRFPELKASEVYEYMKQNVCNDVLLLPMIEEDEMVTSTRIKIVKDGIEETVTVDRILKDGTNYIRLRDFEDVLGICEVDYDAVRNLPIVKKG